MNKKIVIAWSALACFSLPAAALDMTEKSEFDPRMRHTKYNPRDVVQIDTVPGIVTHIVLEPGERYITHAFGDSKAYDFSVEQHHVFLKPKADNADTNLSIVTNRRTYAFRLNYKPAKNAPAMYQLSFEYPDTLRKQSEKESLESGFLGRRGKFNLSYTMSGDVDIAPMNVWDDNEFTYLKFAGSVDLPVIYMVDADGNESAVSRTTRGTANDVIALPKVTEKWMVRLGSRALWIFNEDYRPAGEKNETGTASPNVKRVIKESSDVR